MKKIVLHGRLGAVVGREWTLAVDSVAEGVRAIEAISGKMFQYLLDSSKRGVGYRILLGTNGVYITHESELQTLLTDNVDEIHFYPDLIGADRQSKMSWGQIILGAVIIVAAILVTGGAAGFAAGFSTLIGGGAGTLATSFALMGASMMLGGISSLIAGQPKMGEIKERDRNASYLFSGAVNTTRQGGPIPIGYGEMYIGSQVVALAVRSVRIASDTGKSAADATQGLWEGAPGGSAGTGLQPIPATYTKTQPIDWVRLPDPTPTEQEAPATIEPEE